MPNNHTPTLVYRGLWLQKCYNYVPFHNFPHAKYVCRRLWQILWWKWGTSGVRRFTALAHDADHGWQALPDDEQRAFQTAISHVYGLWCRIRSRIDSLMMATVFKDRWLYARLGDADQRALADADISNVGDADFGFFLWESARLFLETSGKGVVPDESESIDFFEGSMNGFIPTLTSASCEDQPFITQRGRNLWRDNFLRNRDALGDLLSHDEWRQQLIDRVQEEVKRFYSASRDDSVGLAA